MHVCRLGDLKMVEGDHNFIVNGLVVHNNHGK